MLTVQGGQTTVDRLEGPPRTVQDVHRPRSRRSRRVPTTSRLAQLRAISQCEAFRIGNGRNAPMYGLRRSSCEVIDRQLLACLERSSTDINRSMRLAWAPG